MESVGSVVASSVLEASDGLRPRLDRGTAHSSPSRRQFVQGGPSEATLHRTFRDRQVPHAIEALDFLTPREVVLDADGPEDVFAPAMVTDSMDVGQRG
jgi:hypothetical protein